MLTSILTANHFSNQPADSDFNKVSLHQYLCIWVKMMICLIVTDKKQKIESPNKFHQLFIYNQFISRHLNTLCVMRTYIILCMTENRHQSMNINTQFKYVWIAWVNLNIKFGNIGDHINATLAIVRSVSLTIESNFFAILSFDSGKWFTQWTSLILKFQRRTKLRFFFDSWIEAICTNVSLRHLIFRSESKKQRKRTSVNVFFYVSYASLE